MIASATFALGSTGAAPISNASSSSRSDRESSQSRFNQVFADVSRDDSARTSASPRDPDRNNAGDGESRNDTTTQPNAGTAPSAGNPSASSDTSKVQQPGTEQPGKAVPTSVVPQTVGAGNVPQTAAGSGSDNQTPTAPLAETVSVPKCLRQTHRGTAQQSADGTNTAEPSVAAQNGVLVLDPAALAPAGGNARGAAMSVAGASPAASAVSAKAGKNQNTSGLAAAAATGTDSKTVSSVPLAFAVRVQTNDNLGDNGALSTSTTATSPAGGGGSSFSAQLQLLTGSISAEHGPQTELAQALPGADALPTPQAISAGVETPQTSTASSVTSADALPETASERATSAASPLRSVQVQLTGENNQRVEMRLVEHDGALALSARSPDSGLTRSLQDHMPELGARLEAQQYQTDWWTPRAGSASTAHDSGRQGNNQPGGESANGQSGAGSGNSDRRQNGRENDHPAWVEQLAALGRKSQIRSN